MDIPTSAISSSVNRGDIFHARFEGIEHGKFFVVMGVSEDSICGFFFVNSNINRFIFNKSELLALQYQLRHNDYAFLKYDSFVCASNVKEIPLDNLAEGVSKNEIEYVARLKEEHINDIVDMVRNSSVISKRNKQRYFY